MTRPSLSPLTFHEFERPRLQPIRILRQNLAGLLRGSVRLVSRAFVGAFNVDLCSERWRKTLPLRSVLLSGTLKLAWAAPALLMVCGWIVYRHTHVPRLPGAAELARVQGAYSERISLTTEDNVELSGIWVPAIGPRDVIDKADGVLTDRRPAVLLVHDHGADAGQLLEHVTSLHRMGVHVLALDTRGRGLSEPAAQTFGQLERLDVAAAVNYLAGRPTVDTQRIAVWAVGTGARAAEMAPTSLPVALLIEQPGEGNPADDRDVDVRFLPEHPGYDLLRPVCRWTFSIFVAGGPAQDPPHRARRTVQVTADQPRLAHDLIRDLASDQMVAGAQ